MSKYFIIYNLAGVILRTGNSPESCYALQATDGELIMEGIANDSTQMIVNGEIVFKPADPAPVFDLAAAQLIKSNEITSARIAANLSHFTYESKNYSASQTAQNDLNGIANYASLNDALPAGFPGAWVSIEGEILLIPDVSAFKALYSAFVGQGTANFIKMQTLLSQVAAATNQAELDVIAW